MDHCHTSDLISLEQALEKMLSQIAPLQQSESIALTSAAGRITAAPVVSPIHVPPFANSAMDGYAVRLSDLNGNSPLPVAGKAFAGAPFTDTWPANTCVRIMTGAPIPAGADAVIMQEQAEVIEAGVRFNAPVNAGKISVWRGRYPARGERATRRDHPGGSTAAITGLIGRGRCPGDA